MICVSLCVASFSGDVCLSFSVSFCVRLWRRLFVFLCVFLCSSVATSVCLSPCFSVFVCGLESLPDAEVEAEPARLWLAVHHEARNRVQLIAQVGSKRTDRRLIAQARAHVVT